MLAHSKINYGLSKYTFKEKVYEVALKNNKKVQDSWHKTISAGEDWYYGFMERHPNATLQKTRAV